MVHYLAKYEFVSAEPGGGREMPQSLRDVVAPALPALSPVQTSILEVAGIAAVCCTALLVITNITTRLASRRKGARIRLSEGFASSYCSSLIVDVADTCWDPG